MVIGTAITKYGGLMPNLRTLDRMEEATVKKLNKLGIKSTGKLLERGASPSDRREIAREVGVSESLVESWVIYSNFYLVKGLDKDYVGMLMASGVCSLIELGTYTPGDLLKGLACLKSGRDGLKLPTINQLADWIKQARDLPWKVIYNGMYCFG
jgi:hypothetical protein